MADLTERKRVWLEAWCSVASCWNMVEIETCATWADHCLEAFDKRFPETKENDSDI